MSLAETAILAVELQLGTRGSFKGATSEINAVEGAAARGTRGVSGLSGGFGRATGAAKSFGGALSSAGGHLKNLITGPLGIIGLGGGLFALGGIFESSVRHASDMGFAVEKLTGLTGESATSMSQLLVTFEKFGITADRTAQIVGFTEKTLGKLGETTSSVDKKTGKIITSVSKLITFQKQFGIVVTDSHGKALAFGAILGHVADYYNSTATAANKAVVAATLFGRGYAQMIPILKLGSAGIRDAEAAAAALGLTLTAQNAVDLKDYRGALRDVGEAIGGLQLQIGLVLLPEVAKLAKGLTGFLEHGGTQQIVGFFKDAASFAEGLGHVISTSVIPTIQGLASAAKGFWDGIPAPLREILFNGFIADRTVKFLFGASPIHFVVDSLESAVSKGIGSALAGSVLSKAFVQPVFVTNWAMMGGAGALGGIAEGAGLAAAGGLSVAEVVAAVVTGAPLAILAAAAAGIALSIAVSGTGGPLGTGNNNYSAGGAGTRQGPGYKPQIGWTGAAGSAGKAADDLSSPNNPMNLRLGKIADDLALARGATASASARTVHVLDAIHLQLINANRTLKTSDDPAKIAKAAIAAANAITKGVGSVGTTKDTIANLEKALSKTHDPKLEATLRAAIHAVEAKIPGREYAQKALDEAKAMLADGKLSRSELVRIKTLEADLNARGLPKAARDIAAKVEAAQRAQVAATNAGTNALKAKKTNLNVTVHSPAVNVSIRDIINGAISVRKYGSVSTSQTTRSEFGF